MTVVDDSGVGKTNHRQNKTCFIEAAAATTNDALAVAAAAAMIIFLS